jgi:membrane protein
MLKYGMRVLSALYHLFMDTGCSYRAASLVYATLLSMVPLTIVAFTVLSLVPHMHPVGIEVQTFIFTNFVAGSAQVVLGHLQGFLQNVSKLSWINLVFLVLVCLLMIYNMSCAFNSIWGVRRHRNLMLTFFVYFVVLIAGPPLVAAMLVASTFVFSLPYISQVIDSPFLKNILFIGLPYAVTFLVFTLLNWVLPTRKIPLKAALLGGLVTTVLFLAAKWGFTQYLHMVPTYKLLYGTLAAIPIFLLWLYLCWVIVLLGAMVARLYVTGLPAVRAA